MRRSVRLTLRGCAALGVAALAFHLAHGQLGLGGHGADSFAYNWVYDGAIMGSALACLARGMLVSDDDGRHWTPAVAGLDDPDVHQILPSTRAKGLIVAACGEGVYRSLDRGEHWQKVTPSGARDFGSAVTEDGSGAIYLGIALGRPNTWLRRERADAAVFFSVAEYCT